ncbi:hypothetical protein [Secundilactobacillus odoratitofui]|uniref:hypothetical protein n=1 Tax=Secundilactobacillus odoratitofui TaxID=480930 RepID=UPI0006CF915E|nr:hypothetical protein [Secundilactobacillus odoratitofui]
MIKAIVFDLDDTLYDQQRPFQQALLSVWNDPAVSGSVLNDLFSTFKQLNDRVTTLETLNMTQVFDQLNTVLAHHDLPALAGSVWLALGPIPKRSSAHSLVYRNQRPTNFFERSLSVGHHYKRYR